MVSKNWDNKESYLDENLKHESAYISHRIMSDLDKINPDDIFYLLDKYFPVFLKRNPDVLEELFLDFINGVSKESSSNHSIDILKRSQSLSIQQENIELNNPNLESEIMSFISEHKDCLTSDVIGKFEEEDPILIAKILNKLETVDKIQGQL